MCWGKDFETFHISRKILHEELDHEQDWEDFLQDIKTGAQYAKNKQPSDKAE
jgi:ferritin-like protein